jgi:methylmalonyl-CoA mutase N-terminal domain/subunit
MIEAIETGYVQMEIQRAAYKFNQELEAGEKIVVGVNKFTQKENSNYNLMKIDEKIQHNQIEFLNKVKNERNNEEVKTKLSGLKIAAIGDENLMPFIIDAVNSYSSIGEICNTLRTVFGEYKEHVVI